jgi:PPOX class probable F420-dependent enzyme
MDESLMRARVAEGRVGRLATVTAQGRPHAVPCCYALLGDAIVTAVDAKPKSTSNLRRLDNVRANPVASLLVDHYDDSDWAQLWWVRVDGRARVVASGEEREAALDVLAAKYEQYRERRPPGAVLVVEQLRWRGWP